MKAPVKNPYHILPALKTLKNSYSTLTAEEAEALKRQVVFSATDPAAVARYVDLAGDDWAHIYPPRQSAAGISTTDAIDTFLNIYGHTSAEETALLEKLIFNPTADYATVLEQQEETAPSANSAPHSEQDDLLDAFLAKSKAPIVTAEKPTEAPAETPAEEPVPSPEPPKPPLTERKNQPRKTVMHGASTLSESLAKVYIKQHRYERAYEIISELNLNNPEKSVYFADQLRFLKKLIDIEKARKTRQNEGNTPN